jgi:hypothetical protein
MNTSHDPSAERYDSTPAGTPARFSAARSRHKWLFRWGAGITLAGFLAGGGVALAAVSGGGRPAAGASGSTQRSAQGADLNSALNTASTASSTVPAPRIRWALARLGRFGVDGVLTYHNKKGFHTVAFERGTIQSVSGSDVVVKAADGTTWTWAIVSDTVVRKSGGKTTASALSAGEAVFAGGPVVNGAKDARLIVVRAAKSGGSGGSGGSTSTPTPTPSGSTSAQTSLS